MFTLSIEHAISDLATWTEAFERFADARANAGVLRHRIRHPVGDPHYVMIELDFEQQAAAEGFRHFLQAVVWASRDASPALIGTPETRILEACPPVSARACASAARARPPWPAAR